MTRNLILTAIIIMILVSPQSVSGAIGIHSRQKVAESENFDTFFKRFKTDSVFQKSRVRFPLQHTILEDDGSKSVRMITRSEWHYSRVFVEHGSKGIIHKSPAGTNKMKVKFQVEDTGFELHLLFVSDRGQWRLTEVEDASD